MPCNSALPPSSASSGSGVGARGYSMHRQRTPDNPTPTRSPAIGSAPRATGARTAAPTTPHSRSGTPTTARHCAKRWTSSKRSALDPRRRWSPADCASSASAASPEARVQRPAPTRPASPRASSRCSGYWPRACATHRSPNEWSCPGRPSTTTCQQSCASSTFAPEAKQLPRPGGSDSSVHRRAPLGRRCVGAPSGTSFHPVTVVSARTTAHHLARRVRSAIRGRFAHAISYFHAPSKHVPRRKRQSWRRWLDDRNDRDPTALDLALSGSGAEGDELA